MTAKKFLGWIVALAAAFVVLFFILPFFILTVIFSVPQMLADKSERIESKKQVAVLDIEGVMTEGGDVLDQLYKQANSKNVKGIVLRINSPGGAVAPAQAIYEAVRKLKELKPIVAVMDTVAASGGLYSALSATKILAQPGTLTGSIGVIVQLPNFGKITDRFGVDLVTIKSGEFKDVGNSFRAMTDREKALLQGTVDGAYSQFLKAVVESRKLNEVDVRKWADGRVILGSDAKTYGLIDGFGDIYDAGRIIFEEIGAPLIGTESPDFSFPMEDSYAEIRKILGVISSIPELLGYRNLELKFMML